MTDGLDANDWQRAGALFHVLVALDPAERSARLSSMSTDPALRSAVEALLAGDAVADDRLPQPGFGVLETWSAADPLQLVGRTVSHFLIGESLASGGMGVVYRAEDLQLRRSVALKFLLPQYQLTDSSKERFVREARAAGALDHPNLCPVYEIGESSAGLFLAMPLYGGETLKDRLARTGTIPADEALAIASQIAAGLHHAHAAGILHRDIKPGNVMLLPDGTAKILDFGLAKVRAEPTTSAVLGTVSYMSPEQVRGETVDARTDLWALGVILYEMLCGVRPFTADHERAILRKIENARPRPVSELVPSVAPEVEALVLALLEKNPDARCARASEVVDAIAAIQSGAGSGGHPARRRARRLTVAAGAGLVALIATAYVGVGPGRALLHKGANVVRDPLVVADFNVAGSDSALGPILTEEFGRSLERSKLVAVMRRGRVDAALERMRRAPGTRLTPALAREVAQREGARAFVRGDLEQLGSGYLLSVQLIAAETGDELASFHATAPRPESDLLPALDGLGVSLRRAMGDSLRDVPAGSPLRPLTTSSLEALRLFDATFPRGRPAAERLPMPDMLVRLRQIVALDSTFAYAWLMMANTLSLRYRTDTRDSALTMSYRFRDRLTPFERAQATAWYWTLVGHDRPQAFAAYESLLAAGDVRGWVAMLNLAGWLDDAREFRRSETVLRGLESALTLDRLAPRPRQSPAPSFLYLVDANVGQGRLTVADSLLASEERDRPRSETLLRARLRVAIATLQLDSAEAFAIRRLRSSGASGADTLAGIARTRGRLSDAHRFEVMADSTDASALRAVQFVPVFDRPLSRAAEDLWLLGEPRHAIVRLDDVFAAHPVRSLEQIQNRMDAVRGAALYAAAGRPDRARTILAEVMATSDSIGRRAVYSSRLTALGEIALAEGRPRDAMTLFHESDLAPDGLPATRCAVCVFPRLARAAERAAWADSARIYWERYVTTVSLDRVATDQWFLAMAYRRLGESYASAGDAEKAADYRAKLEKLWVNADAAVRKTELVRIDGVGVP